MPRLLLLVCILIASGVLGACGQAVQYQANQANIGVTVQMSNAPQINQSQPATLTFRKDDAPLTVQNVVCDMQMVGMTMGSNRPMADAQPDGSHVCNLLFTMEGEWMLVVTGTADNQPIRIVVPKIIVAK
ncbi:MAG: hypothetical protein DWI30_06435 [Chloroflexi bacterium]|nr:MAG: hypothetical protein DWI30_06435 [Chloroflexota bacterium]